MDHILSVLIFLPAVAGILGFLVNKESAKTYAIAVAGMVFVLSLWLWLSFDASNPGMQFVQMIPIIESFGVNYYIGVDGISLFLVVLATFMTLIALMSLTIKENVKNLVISVLFLEMTMIGVFVALDAILFYIFWELSLVPMLYIIGAWGGPLRVYAAVKFFLYTFAGSLIMLVGMLSMGYFYYEATGVWSFSITEWHMLVLPFEYQLWLFVAFFLGFAIKVPMFPFHTWLPYAHGQAPTIGSVLLAAVLLKMGTYGFVRFSLPMFPVASVYFLIPIAILSLIMIIYTAMIAFAQRDIKQVIAYSSVSHMGVIMLGLFSMNAMGLGGSIFLMISHGIVSGALFMLVGMIYDRKKTKMMDEYGGIASVMPKYAAVFGVMLMASVGLPLTIGFVGEFLSLLGFYNVSHTITLLAGTTIILGAIYMLTLYKKTFFGPITKPENKKLVDLNAREITALAPLVVVVIWLGVYPKPVLGPIDNSVNSLISFMHDKVEALENTYDNSPQAIAAIDRAKEIIVVSQSKEAE